MPGWAQNRVEESWRSGLAAGFVIVHDCSLNCQNPVVQEGRWLAFPGWKFLCLLGKPLVVDKENPYHCGKDAVSANAVVSLFLARAFVPNLNDLIQSFSSQPLLSDQWPSNLVTWRARPLEPTSRLKATLPCHQEPEWTLKRWGQQAVPLPLAILVSSQKAIA